jgi:hypothetical protein
MTFAIARLDQLGRRARISTKAWYAAFLLLKNRIDPAGSQIARSFFNKRQVRSFSSFEKPHHRFPFLSEVTA